MKEMPALASRESIIEVLPGKLVSERVQPASIILPPELGAKQIDLDHGSVWKIGRSDASDIIIADSAVSRNHAIVQRQTDGYYLIDMGSRNGCFVNGSRVSIPVVLQDGDVLLFGEHELIFQQTTKSPAESPAKDGDATRV